MGKINQKASMLKGLFGAACAVALAGAVAVPAAFAVDHSMSSNLVLDITDSRVFSVDIPTSVSFAADRSDADSAGVVDLVVPTVGKYYIENKGISVTVKTITPELTYGNSMTRSAFAAESTHGNNAYWLAFGWNSTSNNFKENANWWDAVGGQYTKSGDTDDYTTNGKFNIGTTVPSGKTRNITWAGQIANADITSSQELGTLTWAMSATV